MPRPSPCALRPTALRASPGHHPHHDPERDGHDRRDHDQRDRNPMDPPGERIVLSSIRTSGLISGFFPRVHIGDYPQILLVFHIPRLNVGTFQRSNALE